jgi:hypothetical protein
VFVQISDHATNMFEDIVQQDRIPIDMFVSSEPLTLAAYIEECRIVLWDYAFITVFRGHDCFKKIDDFQGYKGTDLVVKKILFRCLLCFPFML